MTEKRFTFDEDANEDDMYEMGVFLNNGKVMETIDVLNCLNNLYEENKQLKQYRDAIMNWDSSKIIRVNMNTGEVDLVDKELIE